MSRNSAYHGKRHRKRHAGHATGASRIEAIAARYGDGTLLHDDAVDALAIALHAYQPRHTGRQVTDSKGRMSHPVPTPASHAVRRRMRARDGFSAVLCGVAVGAAAAVLCGRRRGESVPRGADA